MRIVILIGILFAIVWGGSGGLAEAMDPNSFMVVYGKPGEYRITHDIWATREKPNGILIRSSNVTLNCGSKVPRDVVIMGVVSVGMTYGIYIDPGVSNVKIIDCRIENFETGITQIENARFKGECDSRKVEFIDLQVKGNRTGIRLINTGCVSLANNQFL